MLAPPSGSTPIRSAGLANRVEVEDGAEVVDVGPDEVAFVRRVGGEGAGERRPLDVREVAFEDRVGALLDRPGDVGCPAGPPVGGLYLKPPSSGGLWLRRDDDAVGEPVARGPGCSARIAWETAGVGV